MLELYFYLPVLGKKRSHPSHLLRVCVGLSISGKLNISWDPLPCHLQNGFDVMDYIIQYIRLSTGLANNISNSDRKLECRQEPSGPYACLASSSLFIPGETYSFQVAAQSIRGVGSFSNPIITVSSPQRKYSSYFKFFC